MPRYTMGPKEAQLSLLGVCRSTPSSAAQAVGPYETFSKEDQRGRFVNTALACLERVVDDMAREGVDNG